MNETLSAQRRSTFGKKLASERKTGRIPAVLYGPDLKESVPLFVAAAAFGRTFAAAHHTAPITLVVADDGKQEKHRVLIYAVVTDPVRDSVQHVDFYQFSELKKVRMDIPVVLAGEAPAQKLGALIMKNMETIEVECSPLHIPEHIMVDVTGLVEFDQTVYVRDLALPEGVTVHLNPDLPVVSAVPPISEAELASLEAKATAPAKEPELAEKKGKAEEEASAEEAGTQKAAGK